MTTENLPALSEIIVLISSLRKRIEELPGHVKYAAGAMPRAHQLLDPLHENPKSLEEYQTELEGISKSLNEAKATLSEIDASSMKKLESADIASAEIEERLKAFNASYNSLILIINDRSQLPAITDEILNDLRVWDDSASAYRRLDEQEKLLWRNALIEEAKNKLNPTRNAQIIKNAKALLHKAYNGSVKRLKDESNKLSCENDKVNIRNAKRLIEEIEIVIRQVDHFKKNVSDRIASEESQRLAESDSRSSLQSSSSSTASSSSGREPASVSSSSSSASTSQASSAVSTSTPPTTPARNSGDHQLEVSEWDKIKGRPLQRSESPVESSSASDIEKTDEKKNTGFGLWSLFASFFRWVGSLFSSSKDSKAKSGKSSAGSVLRMSALGGSASDNQSDSLSVGHSYPSPIGSGKTGGDSTPSALHTPDSPQKGLPPRP